MSGTARNPHRFDPPLILASRLFQSYPVRHRPGPGEVDVGRMRMTELMRAKAAQWAAEAACRRDGSCPELSERRSEGFYACENGEACCVRCASNVERRAWGERHATERHTSGLLCVLRVTRCASVVTRHTSNSTHETQRIVCCASNDMRETSRAVLTCPAYMICTP